ncbi:MAG: BatD family protein [Gammaproteobacteria bacterium]|nr:BatD family protein [Gammaproteobacteria bacterium]MBU2056199.1 BatD family protein [Gammaproteobacteria bacterium]MBU2176936.1 BatD family protein [Gammaproteobacteria bacterium]MBU2248944.1 BatD family protein [Gammaproteobacteria bacterium]MBU2344886.1 BatD family protein [Gammaproteobacteria bacterium]
MVKQWLGLFLILSSPVWALTELKVSLDKNPLLLGETAVLELVADDQVAQQPDFSVLDQHFIVQGPSMGQQMQIINGQASRTTSWRLLMKAKKAGTFVIPAFQIEGISSSAIEVQVLESSASTQNSNDTQLFLQSSLDSSELYVQQLAYLDVKIFFQGDLQRGSLSEPKVDGLSIEQLGKDKEGSELVNGERYRTFTRRYRLIPERSGTFVLPGSTLSGEMLDKNSGRYDYFAQTKAVSATASDLTIEVAAKPDNFPGDWLIADLVSLNEEWSPATDQLTQGEPVTRTITLTALDVAEHQLPDLPLNAPDGVKLYKEQPQAKQAERNGTLVAQKVFSMAVVANKTGELVLPEVKLPWWNKKTNSVHYATLPEKRLTVEVNPELPQQSSAAVVLPASQGTSSATETAENNPWQWNYTSSVLSALWLFSVVALLWFRPKRTLAVKTRVQSSASAKANPKKLQHACHNNEAGPARQWLMLWAQQQFGKAPASLTELAHWCKDENFAEQLQLLNQQLYQKDQQNWQGKMLWICWSKLVLEKSEDKNALPELYPE